MTEKRLTMRANVKKIRKHKRYTVDFKKQIVKEFESGKFSVLQLEKLHGINNASIYKWIYQYSKFNEKDYRIIEMKKSSSKKVKDLEKKVKELERIVGSKQLMIDYLEKMMEIAKDELDIDIKKNYGTLPSIGSKKIEDK